MAAVAITRAEAVAYIRNHKAADNFADACDFWDAAPLEMRQKVRADLEDNAKTFECSALALASRIAEIAAVKIAFGGSPSDVLTGVASLMAGLDIAREIVARTSTPAPAEVATDGR